MYYILIVSIENNVEKGETMLKPTQESYIEGERFGKGI